MTDYSIYSKRLVSKDELSANRFGWSRFISSYNGSQRVNEIFSTVKCAQKHWLVCAEYNYSKEQLPSNDVVTIPTPSREDEFINYYLEKHPIGLKEPVAIDATGFLRPQLLYLLWSLSQAGLRSVDFIYSEPLTYIKGAETLFSGPEITEVRIVSGFEGSHIPQTDRDLLLVGCGYDQQLMEYIADSKAKARKVQLFPFPALRPHMYQENRLQTHKAAVAFGTVDEHLFAPAHDPFATAQVLHDYWEKKRTSVGNLYLSPLATKPQVIGFGIFYLFECQRRPASIVFPFTREYAKVTSDGLTEIWLYRVEFPTSSTV